MASPAVIDVNGLAALIAALQQEGYRVIGPIRRDGAIIYDEISQLNDLPFGWGDEQEAGMYRVRRREDNAVFGYAVGPHSWKRFLHPSPVVLWRARRRGNEWMIEEPVEDSPRLAFLGVRSCDLHAIGVLDRVLHHGSYIDPIYAERRESAFVIVVQCAHFTPRTCFCTSMGTGPKATQGFDLALTELVEPDAHRFVVEVGSARGAAILQQIPHRPAEPTDVTAAEHAIAQTAASMGRQLQTAGLPAALLANLEHPHWDKIAQRCLACGNCTMVCPTCFCFSVEDRHDLTGTVTERIRRLDVCFTTSFTYTAGKPLRQSIRSRYRQWLTHKLATWVEQFGTFGCVGCGRCITWCPVGIDLTIEAAAITGREQTTEGVV
uniref:Sulfite reductase subunit A n=1 Tax=Thermomicrobium roseum TaxID=500 RepID=A0A7C1XMF4_THERO